MARPGPERTAWEADGPVRVAVVGLGYWGPGLLRNLLSIDACEVAAVVDRDPRRAEVVRRAYPGVASSSWEDVLRDGRVDAVVLATPAGTHFDLASAALGNGKDVLVEKPLALDPAQAIELRDLATAERRILMVGHTYVYQPAIRRMQKLLADGEAGSTLYVDSVRANLGIFRSDTNVLFDLATHDVSILDFLLGEAPTSVRCSAFSVIKGQPESLAYLLLNYASGTVAHIHVNWLSPRKLRQMTVGCDRKMLVYDDTSAVEKLKVYDAGVDEPVNVLADGEDDVIRQRRLEYRTGDVWAPHLDSEEPLRVQCRDFVDSIRYRSCPVSDAALGVRVANVLQAAQRSAALGGNEVAVEMEEAGRG